MPQAAEVASFQSLLDSLAQAAVRAVATLFGIPASRAEKIEQYPVLVDPYVSAAGLMATEWYANLAPDVSFDIEPVQPDLAVLESNAGWALAQSDPVTALTVSTERQVFQNARNTVETNATREGVRYARYASATACSWCRVMAMRGAAYRAEQTAAASGHNGCKCLVVPVRDGDSYQAPAYVKDWTEQYYAARDEVGGDFNAIVNFLRRTSP